MPPPSHSHTFHVPSAQSPTALVVTKLSTAVPESTSDTSKSSEATTEAAGFDSTPAPVGNATLVPEVRITATFEIEGNLSTMSSDDKVSTKANAQKAFLEASNGTIVQEDIIRIELSQKELEGPTSRIRRSGLAPPTIVVTFTLKEAVGLSTVGAALGKVAAVEVVTDGVTTEAAVSNSRMSVWGVASDSTPGPDVTSTNSRSSSAGAVAAVVIFVLLLVAASIGGGYYFVTRQRMRGTTITSKERRRSSLLEAGAGELAAAGDHWTATTDALAFENSQQIPKNSQQMPSFGEAAGPSELTSIPKPQPRDV